ncbi:hypothetical protein CE91St32_27120 [Gordonibacter pamelaeae]|nr:hypothetical protein CE91St32_27120 [Gordonibacter pamelaeae]
MPATVVFLRLIVASASGIPCSQYASATLPGNRQGTPRGTAPTLHVSSIPTVGTMHGSNVDPAWVKRKSKTPDAEAGVPGTARGTRTVENLPASAMRPRRLAHQQPSCIATAPARCIARTSILWENE